MTDHQPWIEMVESYSAERAVEEEGAAMTKFNVGDHIEHVPSGEYLGIVRKVGNGWVWFDGPRSPKDLATVHEIVKVSDPNEQP